MSRNAPRFPRNREPDGKGCAHPAMSDGHGLRCTRAVAAKVAHESDMPCARSLPCRDPILAILFLGLGVMYAAANWMDANGGAEHMKCKIIAGTPAEVEKKINDWLAEDEPDIEDISTSAAMPQGPTANEVMLVVTIFYDG